MKEFDVIFKHMYLRASELNYLIILALQTLKKEAARSSETSVTIYQSARCKIPKDLNFIKNAVRNYRSGAEGGGKGLE
jgi:hypothetical protein